MPPTSPRLAFLVPGEPSGHCGITDYSFWIAAAAIAQGAHVLVISIHPLSRPDYLQRIPEADRARLTLLLPRSGQAAPAEIAAALHAFTPDFVVPQFAPLVFRQGRSVYPYLSKICRLLQPFVVLLMMHETWVRSDARPTLRDWIVGNLRRVEILAAFRHLRTLRVYASNPLHLTALARAGLSPRSLPLISNIPGGPRPAPHSAPPLPDLLAGLGVSPHDLARLPPSPFVALFFARIPPDWDPAPTLDRLHREAALDGRTLLLVSVGNTRYSGLGWQRVVAAAGAAPCLRLGSCTPETITRLLHAADCGVSPTPLPYWLKSGSCAAMVACELPVVFSETTLPSDTLLPPYFATLGTERLEWHRPPPARVTAPATPADIWSRLLRDSAALAAS